MLEPIDFVPIDNRSVHAAMNRGKLFFGDAPESDIDSIPLRDVVYRVSLAASRAGCYCFAFTPWAGGGLGRDPSRSSARVCA